MNKEDTQPMPTSQWLAEVQAKVGVPDNKLAYAMGYESPTVIELMKSGQMRVPLNKTIQLAWVLRLKPGVVLRRLLEDMDPELLSAIEQSVGPLELSSDEQELILAVRKCSRAANERALVMIAPRSSVTRVDV